MMRVQLLCFVATATATLSLNGALVMAAPAPGTINDLIVVDAFPYIVAGTTVAAASNAIDSYAPCAPTTDESGPEEIYRFSLGASARVTAWVEGDGGG